MGEAKLSSFSSYGLQWCFRQLHKEEFQIFKALLKESASEPAACSFPLVEVDNADSEQLTSLLHEHYKESFAWKLSIDIFEKMSLSALSEMARDEMKKATTVRGPRTAKKKKKKKKKRYFEKFASDCPDVHVLLGAFNPDQGGFRPLTVVLHGKAGIGKSALARRILLLWAQGKLYQGLFSYVFFLHPREVQWTRECSFAELISRQWPDTQVQVEEILSQPERLLFVVDGFEDLDLAFKDDDSNLSGDWAEKQPVSVLMHSLLKKVLLPESSLIITVRDSGIEKLQSVLLSPHYLLVGGLSVEKRMQLLLEHMKHEHQKMQTLRSVVGNHEVFDKCQVSVVCSLVCEALNLQEAPGKSLSITCQTLTGLYASFVFHQLAPKDAVRSCLRQEERVTLKGLCQMAVEGVWNTKFVFYSDDLGIHGLKEPELSALFHTSILLQGSRCEECYMFLHLSLQEFFAALYYVLEGLEGEGDPYPLFTENVKSLMELKQIDFNVHLVQMKRFLFGLMSKEVMGALGTLLGSPVPLVAKQRLLHWISLLGQHTNTTAPLDFLDAFYCLFETQDDEFVRSALNSFQEVWLPLNRPMDLIVSSFCFRHCQYLRKIRLDVREVPKHEFIKTYDEHWEHLCSVLSTHPNLRQLDLSGSILSEEAMKTLCIKLRQPTCKIQNLIFTGAQITPGLRHLWLTLINRNIKYLDLESTHLKDRDVMMACEAVKHPNCLLESLRLDHCELTHTCCQVIAQMLVTSISLKSLSLAGNKVTDRSIKSLCDALKVTQCTLQKLILGNCGLTATDCQDLASALTKNQSLTHLYLSGNSLGSEGMNLLCRAVKLPNCGLQRLILNACNLDVAGCGFLAFALMGNRHLTHLSLSMNPLEDDGMNLLCEVMMEPSCLLQDLELVKCRLTAACCKNLSYVITRSQHLKSLDLAANALGDHGIAALCEGLKQKNSLRRLGLETCGLTSNGCEALSSALSCNQHLTSLNLMQNNFGPRGMTKLCLAFVMCIFPPLNVFNVQDYCRW
uniref:NLR family pyrin domain containing 5 n=1 Tax=Monodon monoceros TaxID=40151 RepID=A0A8C6ATQ7_MONMO